MKDGLTVYFVRHGQTDWNFARRIQGQIDIEINETGRMQAADNGRRLKDLRPDICSLHFIASPLKRCRQTMEIIREIVGLPHTGYQTDDRLKEINFGTWQGRHWPDFASLDAKVTAQRAADPYNWRPEGGESYADLATRVGDWLATLEQDTVVVSHGGVSRAFREHFLNITARDVTELPVPQDKILIMRKGEAIWA